MGPAMRQWRGVVLLVVACILSGCAIKKETVADASREAGEALGSALLDTAVKKLNDPAFTDAVENAALAASAKLKGALKDEDIEKQVGDLGELFGSKLGQSFSEKLWSEGDGLDLALTEFTDRLNESTRNFSSTLSQAYEEYGNVVKHVSRLDKVEGVMSRQDTRLDRLVAWSERVQGNREGSESVLDWLVRWLGLFGGWIVALFTACISGGLFLRQRKKERESHMESTEVHVRATRPAPVVSAPAGQ